MVQDVRDEAADEQDEVPFPLASMPEDCLALALSHCTFQETARLGTVNKTWHAAAESGRAVSFGRTGQLLKYHFEAHFPELSRAPNLQAAAEAAVAGVHSKDGGWMLTVDPTSGQISLHGSVIKVLDLWWADGQGPVIREHQIKNSVSGSDFPSCACVVNAQFFELFGDLAPPFSLPPGWYSLSWKVARTHRFTWSLRPALASFSLLEREGGSFSRPLVRLREGLQVLDLCPYSKLELAELEEIFQAGKARVAGRGSGGGQGNAALGRTLELRDVGLDFRFPGSPARHKDGPGSPAYRRDGSAGNSKVKAQGRFSGSSGEARVVAGDPTDGGRFLGQSEPGCFGGRKRGQVKAGGPSGGGRAGAQPERGGSNAGGGGGSGATQSNVLVTSMMEEASIAAGVDPRAGGASAEALKPSGVQWEVYTFGEVYLADAGDLRAKLLAHVSLKVSWFHRTISGLYVDSLILTKTD